MMETWMGKLYCLCTETWLGLLTCTQDPLFSHLYPRLRHISALLSRGEALLVIRRPELTRNRTLTDAISTTA
jgi:hypothetical protein